MVVLRLDGATVALPRRDPDGRLWLAVGSAGSAAAERDTLALEVYRRVDDAHPAASRHPPGPGCGRAGAGGTARTGPARGRGPAGGSGSPAGGGEPDGTLRLQVRPGHWVVEVTGQHPGPVAELALAAHPAPWPGQEVWVFAAHPELREVQPSGAAPLDPRQTRLPPDWARLPASWLRPGEALRLAQVRRGDAQPAPDRLTLSRDLWLDFGGGGYTLRDRISGELTRTWRLEAGEGIELGQVSVDEEPRLITRLGDTQREGVEVRQGRLDLVADSRIEGGTHRLPASGWALDFQTIETRLHLPPGWDLLGVSGVDNLPATWLNRWTLMDLFLVLVIARGGPALGLGLGGAGPDHPGTDLAGTGGTAPGVAACARGLCLLRSCRGARPCGHGVGVQVPAALLPGGPDRPGPDRPSLPGGAGPQRPLSPARALLARDVRDGDRRL